MSPRTTYCNYHCSSNSSSSTHIPEELPPRGHLEQGHAALRRDTVQSCTRGHGPGHAAQAARSGKERDGACVRGDDGDAVTGRNEESLSQDHVPVRVPVLSRSEVGHRHTRRRGDGCAVVREAHPGHQLVRVREVGVGVVAAKVRERDAVVQTGSGDAQLVAQNTRCVRTRDSGHAIVRNAEVGPRQERLQRGEVEHAPQQRRVVFHGVDDFNNERLGGAVDRKLVLTEHAEVDGGERVARAHSRDCFRAREDGVRHALRGGAAVRDVVLQST